ncbi:hypothetical protein MJO29_012787 [Puccinia striiformis f. sp. tritici]|nr:hypothetical protein MJO29_012787 [Puccinia striiformis f. sp. tritici]
MEQCTGLAIYLFILGELCDSLLNQTMSHFDCIVSAYISHFFPGSLAPSSSQNFMVLDVRQMMPKIFIIVKSIMSGRVKMPKWDHIHSGDFHLSCHFYYAERSDNQIALKEFPTNKQIAKLLKLAEKQAETLIKFTGMQKVPGVESSQSSTGLSVNNVISPSAHKYIMLTTNTSDDVLFSITKQYYFKSPRAHNNHRQTNELEDAFSEAVLIAGETHELLETETAKTSDPSPLNPQGKLNETSPEIIKHTDPHEHMSQLTSWMQRAAARLLQSAYSSFIGKILGLFCFNNGQHNYIRESSTRSKLSYIHVQLFNYTASSSAASAMSDPVYLKKVEHDIKAFQKALKD